MKQIIFDDMVAPAEQGRPTAMLRAQGNLVHHALRGCWDQGPIGSLSLLHDF